MMLSRILKSVVSVVLGLGSLCFAGERNDATANWTFKDIVRDPELASRVLAEREIDPDSVSDEDIHQLIDGLRHKDSRHNCRGWLQELGPRSSAIALTRLNDETLTKLIDSYYFPLKDLIPSVTGNTDPAVITRLKELSLSDKPHLRGLAGEVLAGTDRDDVVEILIGLLHDQDQGVREDVVRGLRWHHNKPERSDEFTNKLYPHIFEMIGKEKFANGKPAEVLLQLKPESAKSDLSRPRLWAHDAPESTEIIRAFIKFELTPPIEALEKRVLWYASHSQEFRGAYRFSNSLDLLSRHAPEKAEPFLEAAINHSEESVRETGQEVRCRVAGIMPPFDKIYALYKNNPDVVYDEHQSVIAAISAINGQVGNGGFEQYLWNSTANEWPNHRAALESIDAKDHLVILDRVLNLFGKEGPPLDRNSRHTPLARVAKNQEKVLGECDSQWYAISENLERLKIEYALLHPESFRP